MPVFSHHTRIMYLVPLELQITHIYKTLTNLLNLPEARTHPCEGLDVGSDMMAGWVGNLAW